jgi:hypothetical protein
MNARDMMRRTLEREVAQRQLSMDTLAAQIQKHGIGDRLGWMDAPIRDDARGLLAAEVLAAMAEGSLPLDQIREKLLERRNNAVEYMLPSNADMAFKIEQMKALQRMVSQLDWVIAEEEKEAA